MHSSQGMRIMLLLFWKHLTEIPLQKIEISSSSVVLFHKCLHIEEDALGLHMGN